MVELLPLVLSSKVQSPGQEEETNKAHLFVLDRCFSQGDGEAKHGRDGREPMSEKPWSIDLSVDTL